MDDRLAFYPSWSSGSLAGSARAMGLTDWRGWQPKFGPEISLRDLLDRFSHDCLRRAEAHGKRGVSACGVYLPDLEQPRPPDLPPRPCVAACRSQQRLKSPALTSAFLALRNRPKSAYGMAVRPA